LQLLLDYSVSDANEPSSLFDAIQMTTTTVYSKRKRTSGIRTDSARCACVSSAAVAQSSAAAATAGSLTRPTRCASRYILLRDISRMLLLLLVRMRSHGSCGLDVIDRHMGRGEVGPSRPARSLITNQPSSAVTASLAVARFLAGRSRLFAARPHGDDRAALPRCETRCGFGRPMHLRRGRRRV
jgi:hypothetical protein